VSGAAGSRVLKNAFWLALEPALRILIGIPLAGFVAHELGVTGYGEFNFALSFVILFGVLANLGLTEMLLRTVARNPPDLSALWSSVMGVKALLFCFYVGVVVLVANAFGYGPRIVTLILLMAIYQGTLSLDLSARAVFGGKQEMKAIAGLSSAKAVAETGVTVGVLLLGAKALGLAAARVALGFVGLVATVLLTRQRFGIRMKRPSSEIARGLLVPGLSFAAIAVIRAVDTRAGILVLERVRSIEDVALFSAAMAPVERIFQFLPAIEMALFPFFSAFREEDDEHYTWSLARALRYQAMLAAGLGLATSLLGPWLLGMLFPASFHEAWPVLKVLGLGVALHTVNNVLTTAASARGLEKIVSRVIAVQCLLNVGTALYLAKAYGALGLGCAVVTSETAALVLLLTVLGRRGSLRAVRPVALAAPAILAALVFFGATWLSSVWSPLLAPPLVAGLYPLLAVAFGIFSREDREYFAGVIARRARG
jgi:PST family polysaccharide transporter